MGSALTINNPIQTGYNPDGDCLRCSSVLKLDCDGNTTFSKTPITNGGVITMQGTVVVTNTARSAKALPNVGIAATGIVTTKGGVSIKDRVLSKRSISVTLVW